MSKKKKGNEKVDLMGQQTKPLPRIYTNVFDNWYRSCVNLFFPYTQYGFYAYNVFVFYLVVRRWCSFRFKLFVSKTSKVCIYNFHCALSAHVSSLLWMGNGSEHETTLWRSWRWTNITVLVRVFPIIYAEMRLREFLHVVWVKLKRSCIGDAQIAHLKQ